jgi:hypothetical protein
MFRRTKNKWFPWLKEKSTTPWWEEQRAVETFEANLICLHRLSLRRRFRGHDRKFVLDLARRATSRWCFKQQHIREPTPEVFVTRVQRYGGRQIPASKDRI